MDIWATVYREKRTRKGKGFSRAELRDAGLSLGKALKLGIPIDIRRRSKHEENIQTLKKHLRPRRKSPRKRKTSERKKRSSKGDARST